MSSRRVLKAAEAIREVVSMSILTDLRDPRIENVTVTRVEVAGDMRAAKVFVSVMADDSHQQLALRGLQNAAGFLQSKISKRIDTRYIPRLRFELDQGVKQSIEIAKKLREVLPEEAGPGVAGQVEKGQGEMSDHEPLSDTSSAIENDTENHDD